MAFKLSPVLNEQQFSNAGILLSGGKIETYLAGSSTPATTYTSPSGAVAQANPIILNSRGEVDNLIYLTTGISYKLVLKDSLNNVLRTYDNIEGVNDSSLTIDQWVNSGVTPTFVSGTQFTLPGDQTSAFQVNRRVKLLVTAGTVYGYISASAFAALTTVTVVLDSGVLDSGLSNVQLGLITFNNTSLFAMQTANIANLSVTNAKLANAYINDLTTVVIDPALDYFAISDNSDSGNKKKGLLPFATQSDYNTGTNTSLPLNSSILRDNNLVAGTAIATTSGTSHDFTGLPSWCKRITLMFLEVSSNGTSHFLIQLGSGSVQNTGYVATSGITSGTATVSSTAGFPLYNGTAAQTVSGIVILQKITGNNWAICGTNKIATTSTNTVGGYALISGVVDRIRLTTVNGTDAFDSGSINIIYE